MNINKAKWIKENEGLLQSIVKKFDMCAQKKLSRSDLEQEARRAALHAIDKFDWSGNKSKLTSYVYSTVHRACRDYVRRNVYDLSYSAYQQRKDWLSHKEENLSPEENHHLSVLNFGRNRVAAKAIPMDETHTPNGATLRDIIPASGDPSILDAVIKNEQVDIVREEIDRLDEREAFVIKGVMNEEKFAEIGAALGVTRQRAQQIHKKAMKKLDIAIHERLEEILV